MTAKHTNRLRGEISATLNGKDYKLVLTLGALAELESALGEDILALANRFADGRISSADILHILGAGIRGGGHDLSKSELEAIRFQGGIAEGVALAVQLLTEGLIGKTDDPQKLLGSPSEKKTPPGARA